MSGPKTQIGVWRALPLTGPTLEEVSVLVATSDGGLDANQESAIGRLITIFVESVEEIKKSIVGKGFAADATLDFGNERSLLKNSSIFVYHLKGAG